MTGNMDPLGPVVITAREIYDQLVRLTTVVGELATQVTHVVSSQVDLKSEFQSDVRDHETRLRALERARWPLPTVSVLAALGAAVLALLAFLRGG